MSERDDEYLWTGRGPASSEVARLEKLFGGEKLRAPLRARPRRPMPLAIAVAVLAAAAVFAFTRQSWPPVSWIGAVLPGVSAEDLEGGTYEFQLIDDPPPDGWQQAIEERLREFAPTSVKFEGRRVLVDFRDRLPLELDDAVGQHAELELKEVVDNSDLMKALFARIEGGDPLATRLGVTAEVDQWDLDATGQQFHDFYLTAGSEDVLNRYLASLPEGLRPPHGFEFALEKSEEDQEGRVRWRTYYLASRAWVTSSDVAEAYVYWNKDTNRPEVLVEFDKEGADRFAELTGKITGHKLAILLDGRINSAPVVQDRIEGGRTSITMGGSNLEKVQWEAQELVNTLRSGQRPLPVALRQVELTIRSDSLSDGQLRAAQGVIALGFGLLVVAAVWLVQRRSRAIDPEVAPLRGRATRRSLPWIRLAVSTAGVAAAVLAQRIPVTSDIDWSALGNSKVSLFALGIMPAISAFILVELASVIVPRWRALQRGGPSARARLGSATAILTILLAVAQSWMIADYLLTIPAFAHLSRAILVLSFTAGAVVMTFLALLISRYGLGNGFAILLVVGTGAMAYQLIAALAPGSGDVRAVLVIFAAIMGAAIATSWILRQRVRSRSSASSIRTPTAGIVPIAVLPSLMALFLLVWPEAAGRISLWWQDRVGQPGSGIPVELGFLVVLAAALSWAFSRPPRLGNASATGAGGARSHTFLVATALSSGYLILLALLGRWVAPYLGLAVVPVAIATAIVMDLIAEWRATARRDDLVPVWPLHHVQRVDLVTDALTRNQIDVHARGLYLRLLLHFFGPFCPVLLYVPAAQVDEARAIIRAQLDAT